MKKIIFVIFAHPDDEAFGPAGTLLLESRAGHDVHLICLTAGQAGVNPDNHPDLASVRLKEWRQAGKMMGARSMHHLGYVDGELSNNQFHEAAATVEAIIADVLKTAPTDCQIEFMSGDENGISGHLDHIFACRLAAYVFYRLKAVDRRVTRLRLVCIPLAMMPSPNTDFMYMSPGRRPEEIDEIIDASQVHDEVVAIMRAHHTQRADGETHIARRGTELAVSYFKILT